MIDNAFPEERRGEDAAARRSEEAGSELVTCTMSRGIPARRGSRQQPGLFRRCLAVSRGQPLIASDSVPRTAASFRENRPGIKSLYAAVVAPLYGKFVARQRSIQSERNYTSISGRDKLSS